MRRRLFERFEHAVCAFVIHRVGVVDHRETPVARHWSQRQIVNQTASTAIVFVTHEGFDGDFAFAVRDADLEVIGMRARIHLPARRAFTARFEFLICMPLAEQALPEDAREF